MASYGITISATTQSGDKLNRQTTANSEDIYTVTNTSGWRWYLTMTWTTSAGLYHTTAAQVVANGHQIPAGNAWTIPIGATRTFYVAAAAAGTIDFTAFRTAGNES